MKNSFLNYLLLELLIRILWWIMKYIIVISFFKRVCYNLQEILQIWRNGRRVRLRGVWTLFVGVRVSLSAPYILYFCVKCCEYWNHSILFFVFVLIYPCLSYFLLFVAHRLHTFTRFMQREDLTFLLLFFLMFP